MNSSEEAVRTLAERQYGLFSRMQALTVGASRSACDRRLRSGLWLPTEQAGVYRLPAYPRSWHQRVMAVVLGGPPPIVASHRAAAVLHGIREGTPLDFTVPPAAYPRVGSRAVHRAPVVRRDRATIGGIPATAIDRTLVDLGAVIEEAPLEQAVEAAYRRGLTTDERVRAKLEELAAPGRDGVARLRRVLDRRGKGRAAGSELEVRVIQLLREAGLAEPVRQYEVVIGATRYFIDIAYPARRLAIEVDGRQSHEFEDDRARQNALVLAGWTVLRFTWADVMERADQVIAAIVMAMAA